MRNFVFHNPTKIIFGQDTINLIGAETAAFGSRALLVYGERSCRQNGILQRATDSLLAAGVDCRDHGGVRSNPVLSHVRRGIDLARQHQAQVIVAVGGGSVIDEAKAIAAGVPAEHDVWQFFKGKKPIKRSLPVTCVLTLAASGSEMNSGMVITNEETAQKFGTGNQRLYPKVSILDPTATFTVPANYTAYGAVDAIAHILEFYCTTEEPFTPIQDRLMEGLIANLIDAGTRALADLVDYRARAELMWASTLALNGLTAAGLGRVGFPMHMIEHSLSALYNVPHGAGLAVIIPGWMQWASKTRSERFASLAERLFGIATGTNQARADAGIQRLMDWFHVSGCPVTLGDLGIPAHDIPKIAANSMALAKLWRLKDYDEQTVTEILGLCQ